MPSQFKYDESYVDDDKGNLPYNALPVESAVTVRDNNRYKVRDIEIKAPDNKDSILWTVTLTNLKNGQQTLGHCLSDDTEVLTFDGWKTRTELDSNDMVMTYNLQTNKLEWNSIKQQWQYDNYTEHVQFKTANVDLSVTPDHMMIYNKSQYRHHSKKMRNFISAPARRLTELVSFRMLQAGVFDYPGVKQTDDEIALMATVIAEGNFVKRYGKAKNNKPYALRLYQSMNRRKWMEDLLKRLGIDYTENIRSSLGRIHNFTNKRYTSNDDQVVYYIPQHSAQNMLMIMQEKRVPQQLIWGLDKRQFDIFLDYLMRGDGHKTNEYYWTYYTADETLAEQIQIMCITRGYRSKITTRNRTGRKRPSYEVVIMKDRNTLKIDRHEQPNAVKRIPYKGVSWCLTVNNHTLLVRRNGKTAIVGNSHQEGTELFYFQTGRGLMLLKTNAINVKPGYFIGIPKGVFHKVIASANEDMLFLTYFPGPLNRPKERVRL